MQVEQEIKRGTFFVFIAKYSNIFIGLIINSILARFLSPEEYGTVGVVTVFITFFGILGDIGIGTSIVQNRDLTKKDISDIFKISAILSVFLGLAFYLISYGIAWFYESDIYILIGQLLAVTIFFSSLSGVPKSLLVKRKSFKLLGFIEVVAGVTTGFLVIYLAKKGYSYYSIVWRSIVTNAMLFGMYLYFSKMEVVKGMGFGGFRKIARYSFFQFAFNFINYFSRNLDNILIGKYMGNQSLGIYNQSYQLMMYPVANLTHVITPVLHPVLAKFVDQPNVIFREYLKVVNILAMLGVPISIFVYFSSNELVYLLLGERWMEVAGVLQIFGVSIWVQMINSSGGAIFQAIGRTDMLFKMGIFSTITAVSATVLGVVFFKSLTLTALCISVAYALNFVIVYYVLIDRLLKEDFLVFVKTIIQHGTLGVVLIVSLYASQFLFDLSGSSITVIWSLLVKIAITGAVFIAFHFTIFKDLAKRFLPKK